MKTVPPGSDSCPQGHGAAIPAPRLPGEPSSAGGGVMDGYRCGSEGCGTQGALPPAAATARGRWSERRRGIALAAAAFLVAIAGVAAWWGVRSALQRQSAGERPTVVGTARPDSLPFGESFYGVHLPADDARVAANRTGLSIRQDCAWGEPGRQPYRGTVAQALEAARLPEEVVRRIDVMVSLGIVSDQVVISRNAIRAVRSQRQFDSKIVAMGFANTLCFGTRVNFEPGHLEFADLYDATDSKGNSYAVMVPYVCGNVSVLAERAEREGSVADAVMPIPGATAGVPGARRGATTNRPGTSGGGRPRTLTSPQDETVRTVPEPGTLVALIAGVAAMVAARRLSRRRDSGQARESNSRAAE